MDFNNRIRHHIKSNKILYSFVADKANIDYKRFSRMMTNKTKINIDEYERICSVLGVDLNFFQKKFLKTKNKTAS